MREAESGRRYVDKLVKVWTKSGEERWVLIHVEVQAARDADFSRRMYVYNYRIFDRYNRPVASLAVLADDDPNWRPNEFRQELFGCETAICFPTAKLLDFAMSEGELEASPNPFSKVVLAHLKALQTQADPAGRHAWKIRLVRSLYECGLSAKDVRELFRVIDWLMVLPPTLRKLFWRDAEKIRKEKSMPYISTPEHVGEERGLRKAIAIALRVRFGEDALSLMADIGQVCGEEELLRILETAQSATSLDDVRRALASEAGK